MNASLLRLQASRCGGRGTRQWFRRIAADRRARRRPSPASALPPIVEARLELLRSSPPLSDLERLSDRLLAIDCNFVRNRPAEMWKRRI